VQRLGLFGDDLSQRRRALRDPRAVIQQARDGQKRRDIDRPARERFCRCRIQLCETGIEIVRRDPGHAHIGRNIRPREVVVRGDAAIRIVAVIA